MEAVVQQWPRMMDSFSHRVLQFAKDEQDWPPFTFGWRTVSAIVLGGIGAAISSAGGLGGGGLFVPLFNILLLFDAKTSAALSNFMILGGSLMNLFINLQQRHPTIHHRCLIDYDVVLLLQPNMLLGISTGVILNVVLPDWVITALLTFTLVYMTIHSCKGALRRWEKETLHNRLRRSQANAATCVKAPDFQLHSSPEEYSTDVGILGYTDAADSLTVAHNEDEENLKTGGDSRFMKKQSKEEVEAPLSEPLLHKKIPSVPSDKLLALAFTWFAFFVVQVVRGGKGSQSLLGIETCSLAYWLVTATQIPLALGITAWTVNRLHAAHSSVEHPETAQEEGFALRPEDFTLLAGIAFLAGLLGGMLGIGGGMIINPLLLALGMLPQVTAGTCASMVFFSSSMSVVQFWLMGRVPIGYALVAALLCSIFSGVGITLVHRASDKYNRASLIVFSVATVMGVSAILMAWFGGLRVWGEYDSGAYMGFHYPC